MIQPPAAPAWISRLKLRHLEGFLILNDARTLTEAATRMFMTQSAVSHWLNDLESVAGAKLVLRGRQLRLTPAGEALRRFAVRVLGDAARTQEELHSIAQGASASLHIGSIAAGVAHLVPTTVSAFQAEYPDVSISILENRLDDLLDGLNKRHLDLVVGPIDARAYQPDLVHEVLFEDDIAVIVGPQHPLAKAPAVSWADLMHHAWVMPPRHTLVRIRLDTALLERGGSGIRPRVETASFPTVEIILQSTDYVSVCSGALAKHLHARGQLCMLPVRANFGPVGIIWRKTDDYPMLNALIGIMREQASRA